MSWKFTILLIIIVVMVQIIFSQDTTTTVRDRLNIDDRWDNFARNRNEIPSEYLFNRSDFFSVYTISNVELLNNDDFVYEEDWIAIFKGDICVAASPGLDQIQKYRHRDMILLIP